ncbi:MAG TPA: hypothetical protein VJ546_08255, partial [Bacillales bacterium]|nr:hypothetical protein [Bacillales bacterium]
ICRFHSAKVELLIIKEFEKYLVSKWDGGHIDQSKIKIKDSLRKYIPLSEAKREFGMKREYIKKLIKAGTIEGVIHKRKSNDIVLVHVESIKKFCEAVTLNQTSNILGIQRRSIPKLIDQKCISVISGPCKDGNKRWLFDNESILGLLKQIDRNIEKNSHLRCDIIIPFATAYKVFSRYNPCTIGSFVKKVSSNKIKAVLKDNSGVGLSSFLFSKDQILDYIKGVN